MIEPGNKCTVESPIFRVTIEQLDIMGGNFNELYDLIQQACLGVGFSHVTVDEYFSEP